MIPSSDHRLGRVAVLLVGLLALLAVSVGGGDVRAAAAAGSRVTPTTSEVALAASEACHGCPCGDLGDRDGAAACAIACLHAMAHAPASLPAARAGDGARPSALALPRGLSLYTHL
ncbi:hypothetical protein ACTZWW_22190, partial [Salinarimonas sp. NSM]|uniref:hypothetical protein n=1 Tax=Salinarimonas sp. NSM TaxID=3458003 RepID=UPI004036F072